MNIYGLEKWHFELNKEDCNHLLSLVLKGLKRATSSTFEGYTLSNEPLPKIGDRSVITDWDGNPTCVIQTTNVQVLSFEEIGFDLAKLEGEDDNLESWRKKHKQFFTEEGKELGYEFRLDMKVVFEEFTVLEKLL